MNHAPLTTPAPTVAVLGAGRLGTVLARALDAAGFAVRGPLGRTDDIPASDIVLLCVPDAAVPDAARRARPHAERIGHVSGATGLDDVDFSIHPLQTFTGAEPPEVLRGIGAAVDGRTDGDRDIAERLAASLGMTPVRVGDRAAYHAAASFASNFVLALLDAAERLASDAGIDDPRDLLAPLVRQSVNNWQRDGAAASLTGPIARGDEATVARQRAAVGGDRPLYDALAAATRALAQRGPA